MCEYLIHDILCFFYLSIRAPRKNGRRRPENGGSSTRPWRGKAAAKGDVRNHRLLVTDGLDRLGGDDGNDVGELMRELLNLVRVEVEETALKYETARLEGGSLPCLPPFILSIGWSAPRPELPIPDIYIQLLSGLCSLWIQHQIPVHSVRVRHVLLHHGTLDGNTYPLINMCDHNDYYDYHRLSEKGRFANVLCSLGRLRALGNILAVCGVRVSGIKEVHGAEVFSIATQAPFYVGWYLDRCKHLFRDLIPVPIIRDRI